MAKVKVKVPVAEQAEVEVEDDGLVEVTTLGAVGTHKDLMVNGVASAVPCGIVMRVTPEAAEQFRQCNLI